MQSQTSSAREKYPSGVQDVDGYYQFKTYIDSNGISTSQQRHTTKALTHHQSTSDPSLCGEEQPNGPRVAKGIVEMATKCRTDLIIKEIK